MCGKKLSAVFTSCINLGSPPRVRGKAKGQVLAAFAVGITPACAGKRAHRQCCRILPWDHPRVCGEKDSSRHCEMSQKGSPPRVRGKALGDQAGQRALRITPACAGKRQDRVHHAADRGITPACAGKSEAFLLRLYLLWDHPRVCGEKVPKLMRSSSSIGSPPRVRGKVYPDMAINVADGITPACAGKRGRWEILIRQVVDHPRVCGEKIALFPAVGKHIGSPPRVRGKD